MHLQSVVEVECYDEFKRYSDSPERALLAAVLWRAFYDLQPNMPSDDRKDAIVWFRGTVPTEGFSFKYVAQTLDLDSFRLNQIEDAVRFADAIEKERLKDGKQQVKGKARRAYLESLVERASTCSGATLPTVFGEERYRRCNR